MSIIQLQEIITSIKKSDNVENSLKTVLETIQTAFPNLSLSQLSNQILINQIDKNEPLLQESNRQFTVFPIKYDKIWKMYKTQQASMWTAEEVDFSKDYDDFMTLNKDEQHFLKMILAFFAASDGIVNFNIGERFTKDVKVMEAQILYNYQMMIENVHSEVYSLMLDNIIKDEDEKTKLFNAIETVPSVKMMADWAFKWTGSSKSFAHRLIAFAIVEGVFFSGAFAAIFWFKKYKNKGTAFLQGLVKSNEWISRDEGMHCDAACLLYEYIVNRVSISDVYEIMDEAVTISNKFMKDALPCGLIGMNEKSMSIYLEFIGDRLLVALRYPKKYNVQNPFPFMETIGIPGKSNFFEVTPTSYQDANVLNKGKTKGKIVILDEF
jgi:ribonucleotide reductase beta subunit family protein with ferritin-like domain